MSNARQLLLVVILTIAASATMPSLTSADPNLASSEEETADPCGAVTLGSLGRPTHVTQADTQCLVHVTGAIEFRKHVFGIESHITICNVEFHFRIGSASGGWISEQVLTNQPSGPACSRQACKTDGAEADAWGFQAWEGTGQGNPEAIPNPQYMTVTACLEPSGGGSDETCEIDVGFNKIGMTDHYELGHEGIGSPETAGHGTGGFRCEMVGHLSTETGGMHDNTPETTVNIAH